MSEKNINVLLVDDHSVVRQGCRTILSQRKGITVIGEAATGHEAIEKTDALRPDIVVMDLNIPGMNGIEALRRIRAKHEQVQVIILSVHTDEAYVYRALEAGAAGYVVKQGAGKELLDAVEAALSGNMYLSPAISRSVVRSYLKRPSSPARLIEDPLTPKEREVLQLLTEGLSNKAIAQRLTASPRTVETHRHNLMKKLDIHTLPGLVKYAIRKKIISVDD